jgi:hypothetical protein
VLVNGQPAVNAYLVFYPQGGSEQLQRLNPRARTGPDGRFTLMTYLHGDGAPEGEYRVAIVWHPPPPGLTVEDLHSSELAALPDRLNGRYEDPAQSGLSVTIRAGDNEIPAFDLR